MFSFNQPVPTLPCRFVFQTSNAPSPEELNKLLAKCNQETYPSRRLSLALEKSAFNLSVIEISSGRLFAFVRATSDMGLNANLWNLVAAPCDEQMQLIDFLVYQALSILKRDMPGCSVSVAAPSIANRALRNNGFLLDPGGIRAMGLRLR